MTIASAMFEAEHKNCLQFLGVTIARMKNSNVKNTPHVTSMTQSVHGTDVWAYMSVLGSRPVWLFTAVFGSRKSCFVFRNKTVVETKTISK